MKQDKLEQKEQRERIKLEKKEQNEKRERLKQEKLELYKKAQKLQVNDQENKDIDIAHNENIDNSGDKKKEKKKEHKKNPSPIGDKEKCSRLGLFSIN
jgi:CRISPR/Cas system CMR-associated protein Cmr3 (group 5 of RAMP superfamily)